jgi:tRNA pseudouridine55 synthase
VLLPVDAGLAALPAVHLDAAASQALAQGQGVVLGGLAPGRCRAYADDGRLLALAEYRDDGRLHVLRGFLMPPVTLVAAPP